MNFPRFFIDRPIFATVLSAVIVLLGSLAYFQLPVAQYPDVVPPTVTVTAAYPGATPETLLKSVAAPIEEQINGVAGMLYQESQATADGVVQTTVTFELGTDINQAEIQVQNRVAAATARLPAEVRQVGVVTRKASPDLMMVVHVRSPDASRDQLYISNYVLLQVRDVLARLSGVGSVQVFGSREYSMRVWLDMERLNFLGLTSGEVVAALREQNTEVAAGIIGQPPIDQPGAFELSVTAQGRLTTEEEFGNIIVKQDDARLVRLSDVARIELGAQDYTVNSYLNKDEAVAILVTQRPGSNALETAEEIIATMDRLAESFPSGIEYTIVYNPTEFVSKSVDEVFTTLWQAALLVVLTVFLFLQNWRSTIVPVVAIPISLVGTFAVMQAIGFSLNSLSLFGLVLAIGIVVDDAIVVVENVERLIAKGLKPREAAKQAMKEVGSALIATTVVLIAVFVPTAFISGLSGQFYRQFALTIAAATAISTFVSLTLSPALCALLLRPKEAKRDPIAWVLHMVFGWFFWLFNKAFDAASKVYGKVVAGALRLSVVMLLLYGGLLFLTWQSFNAVPQGFIPPQDQGYLIVAAELPPGAALDRTDAVAQRIVDISLETPGIRNAVAFAGFSGATRRNSSNSLAVFVGLTDAGERATQGLEVDVVLGNLRQRMGVVQEAFVLVLAPPPVQGIGTGGGFKMQIQDRTGRGTQVLEQATQALAAAANQEEGLVQVYTTFNTGTPRLYADIDRTRAQMLGVPISNVFDTLQTYIGSVYVNDFNLLGRTYRVTAQAESEFRDEESDIYRLGARSASGEIVPLGSMVTLQPSAGPTRSARFNLYPAIDLNGDTLPGTSTGEAIAKMERLAAEILPDGISYEWTELAYQENKAGDTALFIFPIVILLAFLALAAQYESWILPLAVILIVPTCIFFALLGVSWRGLPNDILVQIGFVVLIGLACKNAILIVEFAKAKEDEGMNRREAAIEACKLRLRPILMTALSFVLGVVPLVFATGAGSEMRRSLGTAVFAGMIGVTLLGLVLTPVFYFVLRRFSKNRPRTKTRAALSD